MSRISNEGHDGNLSLPTATTSPGNLRTGVQKLAAELDRLDLIDEYRFLVHPRIAGHGPTLYERGLPGTRRLELISAQPRLNGAVAMHYRRTR